MRGSVAFLLLFSALALPATAGNVYRCDAGDGITSYSNKRVSGANCKLVGSYKPQRATKPKAKAVPVVAAKDVAASDSVPKKDVAMGGSVPPATISGSPARASVAPAKASYAAPRMVRGQVYAYVGKDGVRHYTSTRPRGVSVASMRTIRYSYMETCFACGNPGVDFGRLRLNTSAFQAEIAAASREFGVEEAILRAIMHAESSYNPMALSHAGAQGLMQLMPATARRFGVTDSYNAGQNIRGGAQYLAWLLKRFNGNLTLAAAGYNAGEGAVDRHGGVPPYKETQRYVQRVAVLADRYRQAVAAR